MNRSIISINTEKKKNKSYLHGFYTSHVIVMYNTPPFPPTINDFPYARKNNTPPSSSSWKPMQTPALLGGSSHTSLPSVSRMAKKLKPFQVFFPFFFFCQNTAANNPNQSFFPTPGRRIWARFVPQAAQGDLATARSSAGWRLPGADIVWMPQPPCLAHPRRSSRPLPKRARHGNSRGGGGKAEKRTHTKPPTVASTAKPDSEKTHPVMFGAWRGAGHRPWPLNAHPSHSPALLSSPPRPRPQWSLGGPRPSAGLRERAGSAAPRRHGPAGARRLSRHRPCQAVRRRTPETPTRRRLRHSPRPGSGEAAGGRRRRPTKQKGEAAAPGLLSARRPRRRLLLLLLPPPLMVAADAGSHCRSLPFPFLVSAERGTASARPPQHVPARQRRHRSLHAATAPAPAAARGSHSRHSLPARRPRRAAPRRTSPDRKSVV